MGKLLTADEVAAYRRDGYLAPVPVLAADEARTYRARLEDSLARTGGALLKDLRHKPHLTLRWAQELVRHPQVLDAVEDVIGPDILCWEAVLFAKPPASPDFVGWHQDITYWGLGEDDVVTAWIALSPSTAESGCMQVVPGTHLREVVAHRDTYAPTNMLSRGQELAVEVDRAQVRDLVLAPGEMSLHHVKIFHGSDANRSADWRLGFAIRYLPPHVRQVAGDGDSATLVRGRDGHGHFELERAPDDDLTPEVLAYHAALKQRRMAILMRVK